MFLYDESKKSLLKSKLILGMILSIILFGSVTLSEMPAVAATKAEGVYVSKYGSATARTVCGGHICKSGETYDLREKLRDYTLGDLKCVVFPEKPECVDSATASQQAVFKLPLVSQAACNVLKTKADSLTLAETVKLKKLCKGITVQLPSDCGVGEVWVERYGCLPDLSVLGPFAPW